MKEKSLYDELEIKPSATAAEIKQAYRRLVIKFHPDTSKEPNAADRFIAITEAYQALSDSDRRREYDRILDLRIKLSEQSKARSTPTNENVRTTAKPSAAKPKPQEPIQFDPRDVHRMIQMVSSGRMADAETIARRILKADPRNAVSFAVLADVARARGDIPEAYKLSALAVQYAPNNETFLRKHEELLDALDRRQNPEPGPMGGSDGTWVAAFIGVVLCVVAASYVALSPERPVFDRSTVISSFTMGLVGASVVSGAILAACLSMSDIIDRLEVVNGYGRISSTFVFMALAVLNLWIAGVIYVLVAGLNRSFVLTLSRMFSALGFVVLMLTMAASLTRYIDPYQVMLFSGSFVSLGAIFGWAFADSFKV